MKIALLTIIYKNSVETYYAENPGLENSSYSEQKFKIDRDLSTWTSGWENAFVKKEWDVFSIPVNIRGMQNKWAEENGFRSKDLHEIALEQLKRFKPEILWFDYFSIPLLKKIKEEISSIKIVIGWTGSAVVDLEILRETDLILSCAPETVQKLNNAGLKAEHLNHAFNPLLLESIRIPKTKSIDFSFVGQIFRGGEFHEYREKLLKKLIKETGIVIYSPAADFGIKDIILSVFKKGAYYAMSPFSRMKVMQEALRSNQYIKEIFRSGKRNVLPYDGSLKKRMKPAVYGRKMYQVLGDSLIVLNIHADSSPEYASNMRLFETTGVGSCLLTDWKKNINSIFAVDKELITYSSPEECVDKASWLISNPEKAKDVGLEGQKRVFKDHTYDSRIEELLLILRRCSEKF